MDNIYRLAPEGALKIRPFFITNTTRCNAVMSSRGLPSTAMISASNPASRLPRSDQLFARLVRRRRAPHRGEATQPTKCISICTALMVPPSRDPCRTVLYPPVKYGSPPRPGWVGLGKVHCSLHPTAGPRRGWGRGCSPSRRCPTVQIGSIPSNRRRPG